MNSEFFNKMKEAKKLEQEAIMSVLPDNIRNHVEVIEKEMKAILFECIATCTVNTKGPGSDNAAPKSKVHKVEIS